LPCNVGHRASASRGRRRRCVAPARVLVPFTARVEAAHSAGAGAAGAERGRGEALLHNEMHKCIHAVLGSAPAATPRGQGATHYPVHYTVIIHMPISFVNTIKDTTYQTYNRRIFKSASDTVSIGTYGYTIRVHR
jgi:hypothetical protein